MTILIASRITNSALSQADMDLSDTFSEKINSTISKEVVDNCIAASAIQRETLPSLSSMSHAGLSKDSHSTPAKVKRQDWCRWPICKDYYKSGTCPCEADAEKGEKLCPLAHVREEDGMSETADGFVRICFDSMGLIQPACRRARCSYFHPPPHIRDQIIARRHAQYLEEKHAKILRSQAIQSALMQIPQTTAMNPFIYISDPLNSPYNQLMYNGCLIQDLASANILTANRAPCVGNDVSSTKVPQTMGLQASQIAYPQVLPSPAVIPSITCADYLSKLNAQFLQAQRADAFASYNWLPIAQFNPSLFGAVVQPSTTFAFQPLAAINSVAPTITLPPTSNVLSCVPDATSASTNAT
ncbi:hypothetical protein Aperf_G00000049823 [Anoplocephala perfoliata]